MTPETPTDAQALALSALAAMLSDERRARRFLDLTGIGTEELRRRADQPALLAAVIRFLENYEPDLLSVSEQLGVRAQALIAARRMLEKDELQ